MISEDWQIKLAKNNRNFNLGLYINTYIDIIMKILSGVGGGVK